MLEKVMQQTWKNMKKEVKNGAKIHQKSSKNDIDKYMKKQMTAYFARVDLGGPWRPVNLPKINKTHANNMQEDNKKEDNLKEVYLKKANRLLRR